MSLFLAVLGLMVLYRLFSSCGEQLCRLLIVVAFVAEHRLFSSWSTQAQ